MTRRFLLLLLVPILLAGCSRTGSFTPESGDHIVLIGNSLADRMQHDGWLETQLQLAWPDHQLVVRNQGFTGDRIDDRPRSNGFPPAGDYLRRSEASVIFAMFGGNEAWDEDPEGFRSSLQSWLDSTAVKSYSEKGSPKVVLFSPIAHEDLGTDNLPEGALQNDRLEAYTQVMREVAETHGVPFVDLFSASQRLYGRADEPLTVNGIHLTSEGNRAISDVIIRELYGHVPGASDAQREQVRQAVVEKNWHWYNRYRATDGNDVWGSRSLLTFNDQTNFEVLQHELVQLDIMTANRDTVIWAAAHGEVITADDSNVPPRFQ